jgi:hypothetical protein
LCPELHFEKYLAFGGWKEFRRFFSDVFVDFSKNDSDPWFQVFSTIEECDEIHQKDLVCSLCVSVDETMCAWSGLPNISFINSLYVRFILL